jgi:hypothetical protein
MGHKNGFRYARLVDIGDRPSACWNWLGSVNPRTGYGKKQWHGETWLAHRWVWTMFFGSIKKGMTVNHLCRNRKCVNPHHLEVVSQAENCRHGRGAILNEDQVREIRAQPKVWGDRNELAEKYGVSPMTISDIRAGRSWSDIQ